MGGTGHVRKQRCTSDWRSGGLEEGGSRTVEGDSSLIGALVTQMRSNVKRVNKECRERWWNLPFSKTQPLKDQD